MKLLLGTAGLAQSFTPAGPWPPVLTWHSPSPGAGPGSGPGGSDTAADGGERARGGTGSTPRRRQKREVPEPSAVENNPSGSLGGSWWMKVQGIVPPFYLHHPALKRARPCSPQLCLGAQSAPGQGFSTGCVWLFLLA